MSGWGEHDPERGRRIADARRGTSNPGRKRSSYPSSFEPSTKPKLCECPTPWNGGDDWCVRCGKTLAESQLVGRR